MISQEKIKEWIDIYLNYISKTTIERHVSEEEGYKYKSVEKFQQNFNINAPNLSDILDLSIENNNLVTGNMYFPRGMLLEFAQKYENETRSILNNLFDNEIDISKRINDAESTFDELLIRWKKDENREDGKSFISLRFLSLLLGFRFPEKYNALKPREWNLFCKYINPEFMIPQRTSSGEKYLILCEHIDALRKQISKRPEILKIKDQLTRGLEFTDQEFRWMAQDIIYVTARVFAAEKNEETAHLNREEITEVFEKVPDEKINGIMEFPLEEYLENFIVRNWKNIDFGEELHLYMDDEGAPAQQYPTNEGFIDILALDKNNNFVVIELKKGRSNQQVVGQILAYIAWVKNNLANNNQNVRGIIVAADGNNQLHDAVSMVKELVSVKYYRVAFNFENPIIQK